MRRAVRRARATAEWHSIGAYFTDAAALVAAPLSPPRAASKRPRRGADASVLSGVSCIRVRSLSMKRGPAWAEMEGPLGSADAHKPGPGGGLKKRPHAPTPTLIIAY